MQVTLTARAEERLQGLVDLYHESPEAMIEYALQMFFLKLTPSDEHEDLRRKAIEGIREFRKKHHLTLDSGEAIQDLIEEGPGY